MSILKAIGAGVLLVAIRLLQLIILLTLAVVFRFSRPDGWEHE